MLCATIVAVAASSRDAQEEDAMMRMLTLHQRSLTSDRPLPLRPLPGAVDGTRSQTGTCSVVPPSNAVAVDDEGHPTATSQWLASFASREYAAAFPPQPAAAFEQVFASTASSFDAGRFAEAREQLHSLCVRGQLMARHLRNSSATADATVLDSWVNDCATLLQYVPSLPPAREDHKRLLMLLHDLGGALLLLHLLGMLSTALLPPLPLATLARFLGDGFGEWNRKTALTRALGLAATSADKQLEAVALLRENQLCQPTPHDGADAAPDMWSQVGVRACAALLLRGRRTGDALQLIRGLVVEAPTLHAFISAFELASRLAPPPLPASAEPPPPLRFTPEHMLEVLEDALERPQHGLASEGHLLRWQLQTALRGVNAGANAEADALRSALHEPALLLRSAARCFRRVFVRYANLSDAEQHYIGGWDNTGPNNLFYRLFFDERLHGQYDSLLWMESDMVPVQSRWLTRLVEEAKAPRGFWRKGPAQQPKLSHAMVSTHHYHMNSAGLYQLNQPCFVELMKRVLAEHPRAPHDVSTHLFLHDPRHFHIWQTVAHRFLYTDLVQNRLDEWSLEDVRALSPDTAFVHGKHRKPAS